MQMGVSSSCFRVAIEMKSALGVSSAQREVELRRRESRLGTTQPMVIARLLNPVEYAMAQGNPSTPLIEVTPQPTKWRFQVAQPRCSTWIGWCATTSAKVGRGIRRLVAISSRTTHPTKQRWID